MTHYSGSTLCFSFFVMNVLVLSCQAARLTLLSLYIPHMNNLTSSTLLPLHNRTRYDGGNVFLEHKFRCSSRS